MRILGGHDYYDTALSFGHDAHSVFVRGKEVITTTEAAELGLFPSYISATLAVEDRRKSARAHARRHLYWRGASYLELNHRSTRYTIDLPTVIACGKRYQGMLATVHHFMGRSVSRYLWNAGAFEAWLEEHGLMVETPNQTTVEEYFTAKEISGSFLEQLIERRWTLLVDNPGGRVPDIEPQKPLNRWERYWYVDQPVLRHVEFYRAVPPNIMFQEIDMWISGVLPAAGPKMVEISDEIRMAKRGMDKTSFRRPKKKKK